MEFHGIGQGSSDCISLLLTREVPAVYQSQYLSVEELSVEYDSPSLSFLVYSPQLHSLFSSGPARVVASGCPVKTLVAVSVALFPINKIYHMTLSLGVI